MEEKYTQGYTVQSHFIDGACRFTLIGMVAKAQDLVSFHFGEHALSIPHMNRRGQTWVVSKQHFEIAEYPLWRDELALQSWLEPIKGPFVYYDFAFSFVQNGKKLSATQKIENAPITNETPLEPFLKANSLWLVLDSEKLRPVKPSGFEFDNFGTSEEQTFPQKFPKINLPEKWQVESEFSPLLPDIDLNGHVNNIVYVSYILSFLPQKVQNGMLVKTLDTHYISSAHISDRLICRSSIVENDGDAPSDSICVVHSIIRSDLSEVFRAKTLWLPQNQLSREFVV